jgi:hypothetical protein
MSYRMTPMIVLPLLVLLACPVAGSCQTSKPGKPLITVSKETTWITGPLNADGTVNYIAAADAWLSKGVTRENNAAILILQAFGRDAIDEKVRDAIIKRLGLTDFLDANTELIGVVQYATGAFAEADYDQGLVDLQAAISAVRHDPLGTNVDLTQLAAFVNRNGRAMDLLVEAANRPRYYVPFVSPGKPARMEDWLVSISLRGWLNVPKALTSRGALRAREGKFGAAMDDLFAVNRLGHLMQQETLLITELVGMSLERDAMEAMIGLASSGRLDKGQSRALMANLAGTAPISMHSDITEPIERLFDLDAITCWAREGLEMGTRCGPNNADQEPDVTVPDVKIDYDLLCRLINVGFAKAQAADALPTFAARNKAREALSTPTSPAVKEALDVYRNTFKIQASLAKLFQRAGTRDPQRLARLIYEFEASASSVFPIGELVETT